MLYQREGAQKARREHGQDRWPEMPEGMFHGTEHHTQYLNWGDSPCWGQGGISLWVVSNGVVHL